MRVYREMQSEREVEVNLVTYNTLITCAARCKQPREAQQFHASMLELGIRPTERTYGAHLAIL